MRNAARSPAATRTRAATSWLRDTSASIPAVTPASGHACCLGAPVAGRRTTKVSHDLSREQRYRLRARLKCPASRDRRVRGDTSAEGKPGAAGRSDHRSHRSCAEWRRAGGSCCGLRWLRFHTHQPAPAPGSLPLCEMRRSSPNKWDETNESMNGLFGASFRTS